MLAPRQIALPFVFLAAGCLPAFAQSYNHESFMPGFDWLLHLMGYDGMDADRRDLLAACLLFFTFVFGYFSNLALRDHGLGAALNGLSGLCGTLVALFLLGPKFNLLSQVQGRVHDLLLGILVGGASVPALMIAVKLFNFRRRATVNFFYGLQQRKIAAQRAATIKPELPQFITDVIKK